MFHPNILEKKRKRTEISDSASYSTPKDVKNTVIRKAVDCLLQVNEKQTNKNALFSEEATVLLQMVCVKVPECPDRIVRFKLPHLLITPQSEVCLIVADKKKGKRFDHEPQIEHWKDLLEEKGITEVKTVLPMRQLKVEFDQYELKRRLKTLHDTFLVDAKISGHVSHVLGKIFKSKNLMPTPVRLGDDHHKNLKENIQGALHKSSLRIHNAMITATLRVGHMGMKPKEIRENIKAVIEQLDEVYPGGADNVRSLHIKTSTSIAVPVYLTLKPSTSVSDPHIKPKRPKLYKTVEDELSTIPGARVRVTPEGDVSVIRDLHKEESVDEGSEDGVDDKENSKHGKKSKKARRNNYITPLSDTSIANLESDSDNPENGHDVDNGDASDDGGEEEEEEGSGDDQSDDNNDDDDE